MRVTRITANLPVADIESAKSFYSDYLRLSTEEFNLSWVARYTAPETGAHVQLVTIDASAPEVPVISVHTADVRAPSRLNPAQPRAPRSNRMSPHPTATPCGRLARGVCPKDDTPPSAVRVC